MTRVHAHANAIFRIRMRLPICMSIRHEIMHKVVDVDVEL
jgi:hypothetical protein